MSKGYLALTLHAHLPFVRHPEHEEFLEEDWLFEAIIETYIPLLSVFEGLRKDEVNFKLTLSMTPTLISMLNDELLQERFLNRLNKLIELCEKEVERTAHLNEFRDLAKMYHWRLTQVREVYTAKYGLDLVSAFADFMEEGFLEIITSAATHGYLPAVMVNEEAARAQIRVACDHYEKTFGQRAKGFWLPECAYQQGVEKYLKEEGIRFFFVDAHGILLSQPRPRYGAFAPIYTNDGIAVFGRDVESSKQVWSAKEGYPGDPVYRDFYKDIGFDLDFDYIRPYIQPDGHRKMTGIKYHRVTGGNYDKEPYNHQEALFKAATHADDFIKRRMESVNRLTELMDRPPLITAPYDAELFGHWWYEGPEFLNFVFRKLHGKNIDIEPITPLEYLRRYPANQIAEPAASSWGHMGYSDVWINESNDWIYRHLHKAADRMTELASQFHDSSGIVERAVNQAARELLLAQSSDWAFIMKTGTMAPYAKKRVKDHIAWFNRLYDEIISGKINESFLSGLEDRNNLFPEIDFRIYSRNGAKRSLQRQ